MKVVAAMYLYQPHRAARDFRGIRTEYDGKVFQENHDIIPYHLACYASYKFEFCIRNRRIAREKSIFKYYILFALGFLVSKGQKILENTKSRDIQGIYSEIQSLLADEISFIQFCEDISKLIDKMIVESSPRIGGAPPRERIRDLLRKETFVQIFQKRLQNSQSSKSYDSTSSLSEAVKA